MEVPMRLFVGVCGVMILWGLAAAQEATPAPAAATAPAAAAAPAGPAHESIKIVCDGKVKSDGQAAFLFTPAGGAAKEIKVTLQKGENKSDVCKAVAKELGVMLGAEYKVEQYDDDKVKVEAKGKGAFHLSLGAQSATGITLELK
jgi:hypothetical protein